MLCSASNLWGNALISAICLSIFASGSPIFAGEPGSNPPGNRPLPFTTVVPALEHQTGGARIFQTIKNVYQMTGNTGDRSKRRIFLNQKLDLNLLGPGTNLSFVCDSEGRNWAFTFSNGRFASETENGSFGENNYPQKLQRQGKYPWPRDAEGRYLPGDLLSASNGPHSSMSGFMQKFLEDSGSQSTMLAGHVGINIDGEAYIGYTSASVNGRLSRRSDDKTLSKIDGRVLPAHFRRTLHAAIGRAFSGRGIEQVVATAPTRVDEIVDENAVNHFPNRRLIPSVQEQAFSSYGYLYQTMSEREWSEYVGRLPMDSVVTLVAEIYLYGSLGIPEQDFAKFLKVIERRLIDISQQETSNISSRHRAIVGHSEMNLYFEGALLKLAETASQSVMQRIVQSNFRDKVSTLEMQNILLVIIQRADKYLLKKVYKQILTSPWFDEDMDKILTAFAERMENENLLMTVVDGFREIKSDFTHSRLLTLVEPVLVNAGDGELRALWNTFFSRRQSVIEAHLPLLLKMIDLGTVRFHSHLVLQLKSTSYVSQIPEAVDQLLARIVELNEVAQVDRWFGKSSRLLGASDLKSFDEALQRRRLGECSSMVGNEKP